MTIKLVGILAHPDDEFLISGMLAKYSTNDIQAALVYTTRGEAGDISDPNLATPDTLGQVREAEVRAACQLLGCHDLHFLGYRDSGMAGTEANNDPHCYLQADSEQVIEQLVALIRTVKPQVVVTFEPNGWYGHPDHIAASQHATAAYNLAGNPEAFTNSGTPWQPQRLLYSVFPPQMLIAMQDQMAAYGMDTGGFDPFEFDQLKQTAAQTTHILDVRAQIAIKKAAWAHHQTQFGLDHPFRKFPPEVEPDMFGYEYYIQAQPALIHNVDKLKSDIFA